MPVFRLSASGRPSQILLSACVSRLGAFCLLFCATRDGPACVCIEEVGMGCTRALVIGSSRSLGKMRESKIKAAISSDPDEERPQTIVRKRTSVREHSDNRSSSSSSNRAATTRQKTGTIPYAFCQLLPLSQLRTGGVGRRWNSSRIWWSLLRLCPLALESYRHIFKIAAPAACTRTAPTETSVALGYRVPSARLFALGLPFCRVVPEALEAVAQRGALRWVHSRTNAHTLGYLSLSSVCLVVSSVRRPKRPKPLDDVWLFWVLPGP